MTIPDTFVKAFYDAYDASLEMQPRENAQAIYEGLEAAYEANFLWKPIETAPMDGTEILVSDRRIGGGFINVVSFDASPDPSYAWATSDGITYHVEAFTHWMPLPEPPE